VKALAAFLALSAALGAADVAKPENSGIRLEVDSGTASARLIDKKTGESWPLGAPGLVAQDKSTLPLRLSGGVTVRGGVLSYRTQERVGFQFKLAADPPAVDYSFDNLPAELAEIRMLNRALELEPGAENYYAIPNRMGVLLLPKGDKAYTRRLPAYSTDIIVPTFEMVYGDAISIYAHQSDRPRLDNHSYILDHVLYAEMPVYQFGDHHYWTADSEAPPRNADPSRMIFARGGRFKPTDQFIKNTYEVLSPLCRDTALLPMTDHHFATADRKVENTQFGSGVHITVHYGAEDYATPHALLPEWGFLIESPRLVAFYARSYGGLRYDEPAMFAIRSLDGKPLAASGRVRIYHGFGDPQVEFRGKTVEVATENTIP